MPRRKLSRKRIDYIAEWNKKTKQDIICVFKTKGNEDILEKLNSVPNKSQYIISLIRNDLQKESSKDDIEQI